jgi:hypothetical protein
MMKERRKPHTKKRGNQLKKVKIQTPSGSNSGFSLLLIATEGIFDLHNLNRLMGLFFPSDRVVTVSALSRKAPKLRNIRVTSSH